MTQVNKIASKIAGNANTEEVREKATWLDDVTFDINDDYYLMSSAKGFIGVFNQLSDKFESGMTPDVGAAIFGHDNPVVKKADAIKQAKRQDKAVNKSLAKDLAKALSNDPGKLNEIMALLKKTA